MPIYKRGKVYWYHFHFNGEHIQRSTKQGNPRVARQIEAAHRTALAKGEVGIVERKPAPTLQGFSGRFMEAIQVRCGAKPRTVCFYAEKLRWLLEFQPMGDSRLDKIDEALIETYVVERSKKVAPAAVNRELATLRRLLRLAHEWRVIDRVPRIRMLPGERIREFVLSHAEEKLYLAVASQPLKDISELLLDTGLRVGEAVNLMWSDILLVPAKGAKYGYLRVRDGKSKNAKRTVSLTSRVSEMLLNRKQESHSIWVFPGANPEKPILVSSLSHKHVKVRRMLKLDKEFVLHAFRHTMLTRLGEAGADAFTIMRIAGHSSVLVSQRYVHPSSETVERAFERLEALNGEASQKSLEAPERQPPATVSATLLEDRL